MTNRKQVYSKSELVRDLKENMGQAAPSIAFCDDVVSRVFLLVRQALAEDKRVMLTGTGILEVIPPKPIDRKTPQGADWSGHSQPKLRVVMQRALITDVLRKMAGTEGGKGVAIRLAERLKVESVLPPRKVKASGRKG
jgi:nucleoid DNA-binding protein